MKVVLRADVDNVGKKGDILDVADGFARNYLLPKGHAFRATKGLPPYARWKNEESCVDGQAKSDSESGTAHGAFGKCGEWAQDECPGWPGTPSSMIGSCLQDMWNEGPGGGHYDNMANTKYTQAACGFYTTPSGKVWAVQDFK